MRNRIYLVLGSLSFLVMFTYTFNIFPFQIDFPKPRYEIFPPLHLEIGGDEFYITTIRVTNLGGDTGNNVVLGMEFRNPIIRFESVEGKPLDKKSFTADKRQVVAGFNKIEAGAEIAIAAITRKVGQHGEEAQNPYMYTEEKVGSMVDTYYELHRIERKYKLFLVIISTATSAFFFTLFLTRQYLGSKGRRKDRHSRRYSSKSRLPTSTIPPSPPEGPGDRTP